MYLIRLDDAAEHWNKEKWRRMHDLLQNYGVCPIVAIIPDVKDEKLLKYDKDLEFFETIQKWISEGWTPALHGFQHILHPAKGGLNPVNNRSEFVGLSFEEQSDIIRSGLSILKENSMSPKVFVAPAHTFDKNTLLALKSESDIRIISDTIAHNVYWDGEFYYIPQQSGKVRRLNSEVVTFCYHPNLVTDEQFKHLESFLRLYANEFVHFEDVPLLKRKKTIKDKVFSFLYFTRQKTIKRNN